MKVRCIAVDGPATPLGGDGWIVPGEVYAVLGIYGSKSDIKYRLIGSDESAPALHDAAKFEIISNKLPKGWVFSILSEGHWELSPEELSAPGFWENFFDGDQGAAVVFGDVLSACDI